MATRWADGGDATARNAASAQSSARSEGDSARRRLHQAANRTSEVGEAGERMRSVWAEVGEAGERMRSAWASQKAVVQNAWQSSRRLRGWRRDARRPARRTAAIADDARHQVEGRGQRSTAAGTCSFGPCHPGQAYLWVASQTQMEARPLLKWVWLGIRWEAAGGAFGRPWSRPIRTVCSAHVKGQQAQPTRVTRAAPSGRLGAESLWRPPAHAIRSV